MLAAAIGFLVGYFVLTTVEPNLTVGHTGRSWVLRRSVASGAVGAAIGTIQWFVLRRWFSQAAWWVLANAGAFASAFNSPMGDAPALSDALLGPLLGVMDPTMTEMIVDQGMAGVVVGAITGAVLVWRSRHPVTFGLRVG